MATRRVDIDPDGDTLIILPTVQAKAEKTDDGVAAVPATGQETTKADGDKISETSEVIFKVSMKHLTLASPRAKKVLQGSFSEAIPQESDGLRH
ncbi:hypothetical protein V8C35DRAFT_282268 [Trichoderma chlorosporum]